MLKQRASGDPADAERFFEPIQREYLDKDARLKQLAEQQIERSIMYPGGWALLAEPYLDGIDPLYDNFESFNKWIDEDWGFNFQDTIYAPALNSLRDLDRAVAELDRVLNAGARFIYLCTGPAYGRSPGRPLLRSVLGSHQRGESRRLLPHLGEPLPRARGVAVGLEDRDRPSSSRPGSGKTPTASGRSPTRCRR